MLAPPVPLRRAALRAASVLALAAFPLPGAIAQTRPPAPPRAPADTARRDSVGRDTTGRAARGPRAARARVGSRPELRPPVTPRRAFLSSLLVPGLGQSRLQRPTAGAIFAGVEMAAVVMIGKSLADLRSAKAFRADSTPASIPVDTLGVPVGTPPQVSAGQSNELVRARRLHLEDWIAAIAFNHLISGAEAFVSANLYDLPAQISARPAARGGGVVAVSIAW